MINSLAVNNLRSLGDTYVDLKPITVLVGKNSSGKSSFLRTFPLLRQSVESNTIGPILWYGKFVDFGAFNEAIDRYSESKTIEFKFKLNLDSRNLNKKRRNYYINIDKLENYIFEVEVIVNIKEKNINKMKTGKTILNSLKIKLDDELLNIELSDEGKVTSINVGHYPLEFEKFELKIDDENKFLPTIITKTILRKYNSNGELYTREI